MLEPADELLLKLGLRVSPRTVRKYLDMDRPRRRGTTQRWSTFVRIHAQTIIACGFFVSVTAPGSVGLYSDGDRFASDSALQRD
jgi:hypothetical protein